MPEAIFFLLIGFTIGAFFIVIIKAEERPRLSGNVPKYRNPPPPARNGYGEDIPNVNLNQL